MFVCSCKKDKSRQFVSTAEFLILDKDFPRQFDVSVSTFARVEFCPDNTGYAFESKANFTSEQLADFIYLYLFYSSRYESVKKWQRIAVNNAKAVDILNRPIYSSVCGDVALNKEKAQCVMDFIVKSENVEVFRIRYDEGERSAEKIAKILVGYD